MNQRHSSKLHQRNSTMPSPERGPLLNWTDHPFNRQTKKKKMLTCQCILVGQEMQHYKKIRKGRKKLQKTLNRRRKSRVLSRKSMARA